MYTHTYDETEKDVCWVLKPMGISGVVFREVPCFYPAAAAAGPNSVDVSGLANRQVSCSFCSEIFDLGCRRSRVVSFKSGRIGWRMESGFWDEGHLWYCYEVPRCGVKKDKEKIRRDLRLLERFSKESSEVCQIGFGFEFVDDLASRFPRKPFTEVDEILEKLSQTRAEVKELKRKGKQNVLIMIHLHRHLHQVQVILIVTRQLIPAAIELKLQNCRRLVC